MWRWKGKCGCFCKDAVYMPLHAMTLWPVKLKEIIIMEKCCRKPWKQAGLLGVDEGNWKINQASVWGLLLNSSFLTQMLIFFSSYQEYSIFTWSTVGTLLSCMAACKIARLSSLIYVDILCDCFSNGKIETVRN